MRKCWNRRRRWQIARPSGTPVAGHLTHPKTDRGALLYVSRAVYARQTRRLERLAAGETSTPRIHHSAPPVRIENLRTRTGVAQRRVCIAVGGRNHTASLKKFYLASSRNPPGLPPGRRDGWPHTPTSTPPATTLLCTSATRCPGPARSRSVRAAEAHYRQRPIVDPTASIKAIPASM